MLPSMMGQERGNLFGQRPRGVKKRVRKKCGKAPVLRKTKTAFILKNGKGNLSGTGR